MKKNIYFYTNLLAWGLVLLLAGNYVFGWTTPTVNPPEGDLSAPLDMSATAQTKTGDLIIDSLLKIGRYSSAPTGATGALYYDTTTNEFKGYKASSWDSLGGEDTDTWITTQTCSTDYALQSVGKTTKTCINKVDYSDVAYDLSCTDCIGTTEIADSYVLNTGDAMTGALAMGNNKITGLATPTVDTDAATKAYVDTGGGIPYAIESWCKTTTEYTGNLGGVSGANAKCDAQCGAGFTFATTGATLTKTSGKWLNYTKGFASLPYLYYETFSNCSADYGWINTSSSNCTNWTSSSGTSSPYTNLGNCTKPSTGTGSCANTFYILCYKLETFD